MIYFVDIDNTICITKDGDYINSEPIIDRIKRINQLYLDGNTIVYWTARGSNSGIDWSDLTTKQLDLWNCLRHDMRMQKPAYDIYIDDKSINSELFFAIA